MTSVDGMANSPQRRTRAETLRFEDGSVILIAQDREFRVHRSLLSRESSVFRDMFSFPPPADMPTEHGCPIVTLSDDAGYLQSLLGVIYDRDFYRGSSLDQMSYHERIEISTGIICLAHKYGMNNLFQEAFWRLQQEYPTSFYSFHRLAHVYPSKHSRSEVQFALIRLIGVARAIPAPELKDMIPVLFYLGTQLRDDVLLNGVLRGDGSQARLHSDDLRTCIEGRASLVAANTSAMLCFRPMLKNLSRRCTSQNACFTSLVKMVCDGMEEGVFAHADLLRDMTEWVKEGNTRWHLCGVCVEQLLMNHSEARKAVWEELATIFHLAP